MKKAINKFFKTGLFICIIILLINSFSGCEDDVQKQYMVEFDSTGGTPVQSQKVKEGDKAIRPINPKKDRSIFAGWYKDVALTRSFSFDFYITSNLTLYAKWKPAIIMYYITGEGASIISPDTIPSGESPIKPQDPVKSSSLFAGWYNETFTIPFNFSETKLFNDTTVYAKWIDAYTVTFVTNSSAVLDPVGVLKGERLDKNMAPIVKDSTFNGWFVDASCTIPYDLNSPIVKDITLYAGWIQNKYTYNLVAGKIDITGLKDEFKNSTILFIPNNIGGVAVARIFNKAFYQNTNITEVSIQDGITNILVSPFEGCTNLKKITLPTTLLTIGNYAFFGCTSLSGTVVIPASVTGWGGHSFENSAIEEVTINSSVGIGWGSFVGCTHLKKITLTGSSVNILNNGAEFNNADASFQIFVPSGLVDSYKTANNWKNYATKIVSI